MTRRATRRATLAAGVLAGGLGLAFGSTLSPYADEVTSLTTGPFGSGDPLIMLGPPEGGGGGGGSFDVYQLGLQGEVVLRLEAAAEDGPGADLAVYENPFLVIGGSPSDTWSECLFVEVSTNGADWARFPTRYSGPPGPHAGPQGQMVGVQAEWFRGFAGVTPVAANPGAGIQPYDVVPAGGDLFDLAELSDHPLVLSDDIDLNRIRYVKLIDVVGGLDSDDLGTPVWDAGDPAFSTADVDAICALNNEENTGALGRPRVELSLVNGFLSLELEDDDGLADIKFDLKASWNNVGFSFYDLLPFMVITELTPTRVVLATGPFDSSFPDTLLKVSASDGLGRAGGDFVYLP